MISLGRQRGVEACRLVDLSAGGAYIAVHEAPGLPDNLTLFFDDPDNRMKVVVVKARIVRRTKDHAGLEFLSADAVMPWRGLA